MHLISVLAMPVLWLIASGCSSTTEHSPARFASATIAQVLSTNPVPIEIEDDHVLVRGTLNGREVRFGLDTGATHVLVSPEAAAAAGIQKTTKVRVGGFGNGRGSARQGVADWVAVGPAVAEKVPLAIMPLPPIFGADGFLGLSFLRHFTFRLDYQQKLVSFASPASSDLPRGGSSIPLQDEGLFVAVQAEVDGIPARLIVDTGGGQGLILRSWFVQEQKLLERYPKRLNVVTGGGLLGQMRGEIARLQTLKLGDYTLTNVFVEFSTKIEARPGDIAGFIGAGILRRFNLTFDMTGRRLWIEPNASYSIDSPPPASVRSGLVCLSEGTNWIVQDLIPGSPAAEAGVRLGDRLLEINGVSTQSMKFVDIKRTFQAEPGTRVRLRLQATGETPREVTLILRDLL
jgi:predicted aspartyl protease